MALAHRYSIEDYTKVIFNNTFVLSDDVISNIRELTLSLNLTITTPIHTTKSSTMTKSHYRDRGGGDRGGSSGGSGGPSDNSWENLRTFKSTVIEKKEGVSKTIADIRSCLNKMSSKNYEKNKELIIQYIESNTENIKPIAQAIFDIASTNKFFSEIYAELYRELFFKYDTFKDILDEFISTYVGTMHDIRYVAPNDNYDDFSAFNKKNDSRKATSTFITNLVKKEVLDNTLLIHLITQIKNILFDFMEQPDKIYELDEIMENFYILITDCMVLLLQNKSEWDIIFQSIRQISEYKSKEKPSLSTRAIFKCMDIIDILKKKSK